MGLSFGDDALELFWDRYQFCGRGRLSAVVRRRTGGLGFLVVEVIERGDNGGDERDSPQPRD